MSHVCCKVGVFAALAVPTSSSTMCSVETGAFLRATWCVASVLNVMVSSLLRFCTWCYDATTVANGASLGVPNIPRQPRHPSPDPLRTRVCAPGVFFVKCCKLIHHDLYRININMTAR